MFKLLLIVLLTVTVYSKTLDSVSSKYKKELDNFTYEQKELMLRIYMETFKSDKAYTLMSIAWKESTMGKFNMNINDGSNFHFKGSYGCFHNLLNSVVKRERKTTYWSASRIAEKLVTDYSYSLDQAVLELKYWDNYWRRKGVGKVWSHTVGSYNAGFKSINSEQGEKYAKDILTRVRVLQEYFKEYSINEILK